MAVFRVERTQNYTVMSNYHLRDKRLSLKAKGLLSQMLSLPEDGDYTLTGLAKIYQEGKDAIRAAVVELERAGYIYRCQTVDKAGKFSSNEYIIRERPVPVPPAGPSSALPSSENPTTEKPMTEKPSSGNPTQLNKDPSSKDLSNTPLPPTGGGVKAPKSKLRRKRAAKSEPTWRPDKFAGFWLAYPRDEDRAKAVEQWDALPGDQVDLYLLRQAREEGEKA